MLAKISPWALVALLLTAAGVAVASLLEIRWPTLTLAAAGLLAALVGVAATRRKRTPSDTVWLALGVALSAAAISVALFAPGLLNPRWDVGATGEQPDPDQFVCVPADQPLAAGTPLNVDDWVEAPNDAIRQNDLVILIKAVKSGELPGKSTTPCLKVHLWLRQTRPGRTITFQGFGKEQHTPVLTDDAGRGYAFLGHYPQRYSAVFDRVPLRVDHVLVFALPPAGTESLKLAVPASAWGQQGLCRFHIRGIEREAPPDLAKEVVRYKKLLRTPPRTPPDATLGRAIFAKNCQECHTLYGVGGHTGPDLTKSKRDDLDFLVTSIVTPSAEIAKGFEPSLIVTNSGRIVTGIIKESTPQAVTVQTNGPRVIVPRADIDEIQPSKVSLMPTELLKPFDDNEVRSLLAYLSGHEQVPMLARTETVPFFSSYGPDFNNWQRTRGAWHVDRAEIVATTSAAGAPPLLVSELLLVGDFRVTLRFLPGSNGRGAVVLRGAGKAAATEARVELTAGEALVVVDGDKRRADTGGTGRVRAEAWNSLDVSVVGRRLEATLNGKAAAVLEDARVPLPRVIALEGSGLAGQEVRFNNLHLEVLAADRGDQP